MKKLYAPKKTWGRQTKISSNFKKFLGKLVSEKKLPAVEIDAKFISVDPFVTITRTDISPDMKLAKIYLSHFDETKYDEILNYFNIAKNKIKYIIAKKLNMRNTPDLLFFIDTGVSEYTKIQKILNTT